MKLITSPRPAFIWPTFKREKAAAKHHQDEGGTA